MNVVIAIIGLLVIVSIALFMLYRTQSLHSEFCTKEHIQEMLGTINHFKSKLSSIEEMSQETVDLRSIEQHRRQVVDHTSKKMIITYLITSTPNQEIIHSFSISWFNKKIPIKSATYVSTTIIHALNLTEHWNKELRLSLKKNQVFHFRVKLSHEQNKHYFTHPNLSFEEVEHQHDAIRDMSLDVKVERKQETAVEST